MKRRFFLLSPASTGGRRATFLFNEAATFEPARTLQTGAAVPLGDVFSFLSGLYFRGKLAYARAFAEPSAIRVITSDRGLVTPDTPITLADLRAFAASPIDADNPRYAAPLLEHAAAIAADASVDSVILLGSVASGKYVDLLLSVLGERLLFPQEFVGRGDMSRGGLLLRCVDAPQELTYVPVAGAIRRGSRPPKLNPR